MRKFFLVAVAGMVSAFIPATAQAYCCKSNPAICTAICGSACCTKSVNTLSSGGQAAMTPISTAQIEGELKSAKAGNGQNIIKALQAELDRRKTKLKTN